MLWLAVLFGFVTPETYSMPERKANIRNVYYLNQETDVINVRLSGKKKKVFFYAQMSLQHKEKVRGREIRDFESC